MVNEMGRYIGFEFPSFSTRKNIATDMKMILLWMTYISLMTASREEDKDKMDE